MNRRIVYLVTLAHMFTDITQGALPALLPLLIARHDLGYAAGAGIVFSANMASTLVQPFFGAMADRSSPPWLLPAALVTACLGVALTGVAPTYVLVLGAALVCGTGVAAFHPVGAKAINAASGDQKAWAMGVFGMGGTLGFTLGPIMAAFFTSLFGLTGTLALAVPGVVVALGVGMALYGQARAEARRPAKPRPEITGRAAWGPFLRLAAAIVCRAMLFFGLNTFIPLFFIDVLGRGESFGATALAFFAGSGVVGTLLGGRLADRVSHPRIILAGFTLLLPLLPFLPRLDNPYAAIGLLVAIGICLSAPYSAMIVMGQAYLPGRVGLSSGVTLGLAISVGGLAAPLLGMIADAHGLRAALSFMAAIPVLGALLALTLPSAEKATTRREP